MLGSYTSSECWCQKFKLIHSGYSLCEAITLVSDVDTQGGHHAVVTYYRSRVSICLVSLSNLQVLCLGLCVCKPYTAVVTHDLFITSCSSPRGGAHADGCTTDVVQELGRFGPSCHATHTMDVPHSILTIYLRGAKLVLRRTNS